MRIKPTFTIQYGMMEDSLMVLGRMEHGMMEDGTVVLGQMEDGSKAHSMMVYGRTVSSSQVYGYWVNGKMEDSIRQMDLHFGSMVSSMAVILRMEHGIMGFSMRRIKYQDSEHDHQIQDLLYGDQVSFSMVNSIQG